MTAFPRAELTAVLAEGVRALQLDLDDAQLGRLMDYLSLLSKWNAVYNLTAVRNPSQMVVQHLLDSLAVVPAFDGAVNILDVGAGGGLPGMVLAIARPDMQVSMIDTVHKKTAFLTQAKAELGLANVTVHTARVEQLQLGMHVQQPFDVITSRAFAELKDFVNWSQHLLQQGGRFIALKGIMPQDEIARLPAGWKVTQVQPLKVPSLDAERHLVFIEREGES